MKTPTVLFLTNDPQLEETVAQTLSENGGVSHLAHDPSDALQMFCGLGRHLDLAIIDFDHGPHGMTLLGAINMCREDFPVVVVTRDDEKPWKRWLTLMAQQMPSQPRLSSAACRCDEAMSPAPISTGAHDSGATPAETRI